MKAVLSADIPVGASSYRLFHLENSVASPAKSSRRANDEHQIEVVRRQAARNDALDLCRQDGRQIQELIVFKRHEKARFRHRAFFLTNRLSQMRAASLTKGNCMSDVAANHQIQAGC